MERIVIGVDDESATQVAADWVVERSRFRPVSVTLVTMFDLLADDPLQAQARLDKVEQGMKRARRGMSIETTAVDRSIHQGLIDHSRTADLLVLGSHPSTWIGAAFAGALPIRVAAHAHCPTVIVPDDWTPRNGGVVVAGVGDDRSADRAILFAANEAVLGKCELELIHAWQLPTAVEIPAASAPIDPDEVRDTHRELLREVVDRTLGAFPQARIVGVLAEGGAGQRVASRLPRASLIVLGTHGHGLISGLILGSTLQDVLRLGRVPVCVVPLDPGRSGG
jgi:nucleotide-binding universal stress UspA family protein